MPAAAPKAPAPLVLVCGDDEFAVKQRAKQLYQQWCNDLGGLDHESIDASVANSGEALKALARLREALLTLPFFGGSKVIWLRDCNFLGDERAATTQAVNEALAELAQELKAFSWQGVRLLISAGNVDKRKTFYKSIDKLGAVETFAGWSMEDRDWAATAETWARREIHARNKEISDEALGELVSRVGPNVRLLANEIEKLTLYAGDRKEIQVGDVEAICIRNKFARAFALGDAFGDRDLPRLLRCLDEELWEMQFDKDKSEFGLLYGLTGKVRALLLLKELITEGWIKPPRDFAGFKAQLERIPTDRLPEDRRFNPLSLNPYVLFKALPQVRNFSQAELIRALDLLLRCNRRFLSSNLDEALVLQQTLVQMTCRENGRPRSVARA
jgi:DNA polymerase III subunit delta